MTTKPEATRPTLADALETWQVHYPFMWENDCGPEGWYAVSNDEGIVAYFGDERDALRWRMEQVSRTLYGQQG